MKLDRPSEPTVQQVHDGLQRLFRQAGRGSVKRVESALGVAEGSFRQWRRRGKLPLEMLFRTLEELEIPPGGFWVEVLGSNLDPVDLARRPSSLPQDPVVRKAIARWEAPDDSQVSAMTEQRLAQLDDLRRHGPELAVRHAKAALRTSKRVWLPQLLAVYGTARRAESKIDIALEALRYALQLAEQAGADSDVRGDILQRLGVAYAYVDNHALGLLFAKQATDEYRLAGLRYDEGKSWVDQGVRYGKLGQLDRSVRAFSIALHCLPEDDILHRFAALHGSALGQHALGVRDAAESAIRQAQELAPQAGTEAIACMEIAVAIAAMNNTDYTRAEHGYARAMEIYRATSPLDAIVVAAELVLAQVINGRIAAARGTVEGVKGILREHSTNPLAQRATQDIRRAFGMTR